MKNDPLLKFIYGCLRAFIDYASIVITVYCFYIFCLLVIGDKI